MKKKRIILSVLMVTMLLMPVGQAESESITQFTFMDTITWDSTPDEVESVLGDGVQRAEETDESIGTITVLQKDDISFAGYKCNKMTFLYYNSNLYGIGCFYTEVDVGDPDALIEGLTKIYGIPRMYDSNHLTVDDLTSGTKTLCDWEIGDDTVIKVAQMNDAKPIFPKDEKSPYLCFVSFVNTPVGKQLGEAVLKSETEPEK